MRQPADTLNSCSTDMYNVDFVYLFCLWVCFVRLFDVIKEQTIAIHFIPFIHFIHSLNGATLFSKIDSNKLQINVKNKMTLIDAKLDADLINIS